MLARSHVSRRVPSCFMRYSWLHSSRFLIGSFNWSTCWFGSGAIGHRTGDSLQTGWLCCKWAWGMLPCGRAAMWAVRSVASTINSTECAGTGRPLSQSLSIWQYIQSWFCPFWLATCMLTINMLLMIAKNANNTLRKWPTFDDHLIKGRFPAYTLGNMRHQTWGITEATDGSAPTWRRGICGRIDVSYSLYTYGTSMTRVNTSNRPHFISRRTLTQMSVYMTVVTTLARHSFRNFNDSVPQQPARQSPAAQDIAKGSLGGYRN